MAQSLAATKSEYSGPDAVDKGIVAQPITSNARTEESSDDSTQYTREEDTQIRKFYLFFNTQLPIPDLSNSSIDPQSLPPRPDLTLYQDPMTWSPARKYFTLLLSCISTFLTAYAAGSYSPPAALIAED